MAYRGFERRRSIRRQVSPNRVTLEWLEGWGGCRVEAQLVDQSDEGMLVESEAVPPEGHPVWLRIQAPVSSRAIGGTVVRVDREGRWVGLKLYTRCPDEIAGLAAPGHPPDAGSSR